MKYVFLFLLMFFFTGCENESSTGPSSGTTVENVQRISGRLVVKSGASSQGAYDAKVCLKNRNVCVSPDASGYYEFITPKSATIPGSMRVTSDSTPVDTVVIKDNQNHPIREIPIYSWYGRLRDNFLVQRNLRGIYLREDDSVSYEAVYWNKIDSVAYVLKLEKNPVAMSYSGFVYMMYDDYSFTTGEQNRHVFSRAIRNGKVVGNTKVVSFSERMGDIDFGYIASYFDQSRKDTTRIYHIPDTTRIKTFDTTIVVNNSDTLFHDTIVNFKFKNNPTIVVDSSKNRDTRCYTYRLNVKVNIKSFGNAVSVNWNNPDYQAISGYEYYDNGKVFINGTNLIRDNRIYSTAVYIYYCEVGGVPTRKNTITIREPK